jgi:putative ABC transport system permease protein
LEDGMTTLIMTLDLAFIALLVGAVGIITTLYTSVNERVSEIVTMKAIGAKNLFILALFMSEALLIGLLGATSGILIGIGGAYVLTGMSPHSSLVGSATPIRYLFRVIFSRVLSVLLSLAAG